MLFNSIEYLFFLPIVFLLYWYVFRKLQFQNFFVVVVSYIFYGWWNWTFLLLIAFTTVCSFVSGILIEREQNRAGKLAKTYTSANICINLLILGIYKYYDFFASSLVEALSSIGMNVNIESLELVLPVGISFYTFQALSYTIDVYRKKLQPTHNPVEFFAFISFFPQLVAGPIERATNLLPQFQKSRVFKYEDAVDGTRQILWGLFKKMVIADNCAIVVNAIFENYQSQGSLTLLYGVFMFTFQIYGDFSGYSDIAIGTAKLFGINLMRNFNYPYFSRSIPEFWRRWHISLNTWFTDYIYIPLGGSRCCRWKVIRNTIIVFFVSGLWHGANWTFICWGLYHGCLFMPYLLLKKKTKFAVDVAQDSFFPSLKESFQMLTTFILVMFGWLIFRVQSMTDLFYYVEGMFSNHSMTLEFLDKKTTFFIFVLLVFEWVHRKKQFGLQLDLTKVSPLARYSLYVIFMFLILLLSGKTTQFIYFQF